MTTPAEELTEQAIFDTVVDHLRRQGRKSMSGTTYQAPADGPGAVTP